MKKYMNDIVQQSEGKRVYEMKVIPLVMEETKEKKGKLYTDYRDNLSTSEIKNMSCSPRMFWRNKEDCYIAEMPLVFKGTGVKWALFYVFDELTLEEQERYEDRAIMLPVTINSVVSVYGDLSLRKSESKIRKRIREKEESK